jgi:hypothetical protein
VRVADIQDLLTIGHNGDLHLSDSVPTAGRLPKPPTKQLASLGGGENGCTRQRQFDPNEDELFGFRLVTTADGDVWMLGGHVNCINRPPVCFACHSDNIFRIKKNGPPKWEFAGRLPGRYAYFGCTTIANDIYVTAPNRHHHKRKRLYSDDQKQCACTSEIGIRFPQQQLQDETNTLKSNVHGKASERDHFPCDVLISETFDCFRLGTDGNGIVDRLPSPPVNGTAESHHSLTRAGSSLVWIAGSSAAMLSLSGNLDDRCWQRLPRIPKVSGNPPIAVAADRFVVVSGGDESKLCWMLDLHQPPHSWIPLPPLNHEHSFAALVSIPL